ncbi:MAG: hypothetical protein ACI4HI_18310 [Lachnospiraceae bacterium]
MNKFKILSMITIFEMLLTVLFTPIGNIGFIAKNYLQKKFKSTDDREICKENV